MKKSIYLAAAALCVAASAVPASAAFLPGTITLGGDATGGATAPWTLTASTAPAPGDDGYSILRYVLNTPVTFADLTSYVAKYEMIAGGISQGTPRLQVVTDANHDNVADGYFEVQWGPAGTFVDPTIGYGSTGNLFALTDWGRYDLTGVGGSVYTDRTAALTLAGAYNVLRLSIIVDTYSVDRNIRIDSLEVQGNMAAVPEPATWAMMIGGLGLVGASMRRRKAVVAFA